METKKETMCFLQCNIFSNNFQDLYDMVINKGACIFCGTCISLCPRIGIKEKQPTLLEYDPDCSMCYNYCARTYFPHEVFTKKIFNDQTSKNFLLGYYQKITGAKSTDDEVLKVSQNGGVVSTLLIHALNRGLVDGVLLTDKDENWLPKPIIARTKEEILTAAGSKYIIAPTLLTYREAIYEYKLEKLAFAGMPCQIQAVRKLQLYPPLSDEFGKFTLIIGLYCTSNFSYDFVKKKIQEELGLRMIDVRKFDISDGKFIIYTRDGLIKKIPIKEIKEYKWSSCQYCKDYTAEFADISVGNVGAPANDWNSVILRSDVGIKLFDDATASGKLIMTDAINQSKIKKESFRKKSQITKIDEKLVAAMRFFNVSDVEAKLYVILVSLGCADISLLSKMMKKDKTEIINSLNKLKQREWVLTSNGTYRSVNPTHIIKTELYKFKKTLEENINKIKSGALIDLETLYVQNNLMYTRFKELLDVI